MQTAVLSSFFRKKQGHLREKSIEKVMPPRKNVHAENPEQGKIRHKIDPKYRIGRTLADFQKFIEEQIGIGSVGFCHWDSWRQREFLKIHSGGLLSLVKVRKT